MKVELVSKKDRLETLDLEVFRAIDHIVDIRSMLKRNASWLIEKKHAFQQTQLVLTGIEPSIFLGFDEEGKRISTSKYLGNQSAPASLLSTAHRVVILPMEKWDEVQHVLRIRVEPEKFDMKYPDRTWNIHWLWRMQNDPSWRDTRFKLLNTSYPPFSIPEEMYDIVDKEAFIRFEADRLPLFIGSQFGVSPWYPKSEHSVTFSLYAILGRSLLSGHVSGIRIFAGGEGQIKCVANFRN